MTVASTPLSPQANKNTFDNQRGRLSEDQRQCEDISMKTGGGGHANTIPRSAPRGRRERR